jgi:hypothetical protein
MDREEDTHWFRNFVVNSRWRFAKTYVESYPHEYTLARWGDQELFWRAILCIERSGAHESFWNAQRRYFYIDDRKYWHMGDASSERLDDRPGLINRSWIEVGNYRDDAKMLGYDEQALDHLVGQWKLLLEKAKRGAQ